ncbi:MAG: metal ABC transporter substrate-binding protein [Akkermansia sp.]|nr:metal ABC transporter substrate-binding protein [Akkermansia sp.]
MKKMLIALLLMLGLSLAQAEPLKIASLHPLLSEMAEKIGGEHVTVVNLFPENGDLHGFTPTAADLAAAAGAKLLLACGKGVEPYLADLKDSLPAHTTVVETGAEVPNVPVPGTRFADPHWWNIPGNMKRASRTLLNAMIQAAPEHRDAYTAGRNAYAATMDKLTRTARLKLSRIPQNARYLVTGHAAMCHFCLAFNMKPISIQGIARESEGDTATLAALLADLRSKNVRCLFTEVNASPRMLRVIAEQLGVPTAPLVMDGIYPAAPGYEAMFMHNINTICKHLCP